MSKSCERFKWAARRFFLLLFIVGLFGCDDRTNVSIDADLTKPTLEFRWADSNPGRGLVEAAVLGSESKIYLHPEVLLTEREVENVAAMPADDGQPAIGLSFTPAGRARISEATENGLGRRIAIVVDGVVLCAPMIESPLSDNAIIVGEFSVAEAERIASRIRGARTKSASPP